MADPQRRRASDLYPPKQPWHLDKSIPLGLIFTILVQTVLVVWWAAVLTTRVDTLEGRFIDGKDTAPRLAVVESQVKDIKDIVRRIEATVTGGRP